MTEKLDENWQSLGDVVAKTLQKVQQNGGFCDDNTTSDCRGKKTSITRNAKALGGDSEMFGGSNIQVALRR